MTDANEAVNEVVSEGPIQFESRITIGDVADLVFTRATTSPGAQAIAGFLLALGLLGMVGGAAPDLWVPLVILSFGIGTGFILLPFIWWRYIAVPALMVETVEADDSGMIIGLAGQELRHPWSLYRTATETGRLFILTSRVVPAQMFTKRGVPVEVVDAYRALLRGAGLLATAPGGARYRPPLAFVGGAVVAVVVLLVTGTLRV